MKAALRSAWNSLRAAAAARRRGPAHRFAALIEQDTVLAAPARLVVEDGLHAGASMALALQRYLIGSDPACDIVLQDAVVQPRHAVLEREGEGYVLRDLAQSPLAPLSFTQQSGIASARHALQGVHVRVEWPSDEAPAKHTAPLFTPRLAGAALAIGVLVGCLAVGTAELVLATQRASPLERVARAKAELAPLLPPGVQVRVAEGVLVAEGLVADEAERIRVSRSLREAGYADMRLQLRSAAALMEQLREALDAPELQIRYDGHGRVRVEGTTERMPVKTRLGDIMAQRGADIDDRVVVLDARARKEAATHALPVRITDVMLGEHTYFRSDTGGRYYVGAVLPDGAEVLSIDEQRIVFRRGDKSIVYRLE